MEAALKINGVEQMSVPAEIVSIKGTDLRTGITYDIYPEGETPCLTYVPYCDYNSEHNVEISLAVRNNTDQSRLILVRVETPEGTVYQNFQLYVSPYETANIKWYGVPFYRCPANPTLVKVWAEGMEDKAHIVRFNIFEGFIILDLGAWAIIRGELVRKIISLNMSPAPVYTIPKKGISVYKPGTTVSITLGNVPFGFNSYYARVSLAGFPYYYITPIMPKDASFTVEMNMNKVIRIWLLPGAHPAWMPWEDINLDGVVDVCDVGLVLRTCGKTSEDPDWDERCDIYPDGVIDIRDAIHIASAFGAKDEALKRGYPAGLTVPTQANIASGINTALAGSVATCFTAVLAEQVKRAIRRKP